MSRLDILNLEWPTSDRDLHITTPVLIYLKKKYYLTVQTKSIFSGYYYILKYKPKMILISNHAGAIINNDLLKLAYKSNIMVVSLISEGNVKPEDMDEYLWGWNKEKIMHADKMLLWSNRSKQIFLQGYPELKEKLVVVGGTGFDRYKLLDFKSKNTFLLKNNLKFEKIIGVAAWGFDHFFGEYFEENKKELINNLGKSQIKLHRSDLFKLNNIYLDLIKGNPDVLFILRYHPGTTDFTKNEFYELDKHENVFISSKYENSHYKISDLINVSDLWIGYETTTALEAWLLNKQTFLINPTRNDFIRENIHKGSPIVKTAGEAQNLIDEFFAENTLKSFDQLQSFRGGIIKDVIEYNDGKNHIRAAEVIIAELNKPKKKTLFNFYLYLGVLKQLLKLILSNTVMQKRWPELNYKSNFAEPYQKKYRKAIDA